MKYVEFPIFFQSTYFLCWKKKKKLPTTKKTCNGKVLLNKMYAFLPDKIYPQIRSMWKLFKLFKALSRYNSYPFYHEVLKPR